MRSTKAASSTITAPASTTSPNACGQVIAGAMVNATTGITPSPAAIASGALPATPMSTVVIPAHSAVAVVSCSGLSCAPVASREEPRMSGLSITM